MIKSLRHNNNIFYRLFQRIDKLILVSCAVISTISILLLMGLEYSGFIRYRQVLTQIAAATIGMLIVFVLTFIDISWLATLWKIYIPPAVLLMLATLIIGVGREGSKNKSWMYIGSISIQPSEFLKIAIILSLAYHLSLVHEKINRMSVLLPVLLHAICPVILILMQKDDGVAIVMLCIVATMIFSAGLSLKYILPALATLPIAIPIVWFYVMDEFQRRRFMIIWDRSIDPLGIGYQQLRGLTAMGSGQLFGNGIFFKEHIYVPLNHNDFIFTFLGAAMGFVGCLLVVFLLGLVCSRIIYIGVYSGDVLSKYICVGVFTMLAVQASINIGMCLMIVPVIGVTLPFLSAGGSSVLSSYMAVGLAISVYSKAHTDGFTKGTYISTDKRLQ